MALHALALVMALLALPIQSASAQGLLDSLFGSDSAPSARRASAYIRPDTDPRFPRYEPFSPFGELFSPFRQEPPQPYEHTTYRTLCVRMCDGFYFPVSYSTNSSNFSRDAGKCAASCGREARLFYHPNPDGDVEDMLDLTGRTYASYPTAFTYRKTLVQGCQCRPQPWTDAERARHRSYAAMQTPPGDRSPMPRAPSASPPDSTMTSSPGFDDLQAVARPDAIHRQTQAGPPDRPFDAGSGTARSFYSWPSTR